jgi:hypothetical protein
LASAAAVEGLDVAYSLVRQGDPSFRFSLAHALERMGDTWLVGERRNVGLSPNQDGTALLQIDRTSGSESLRVYPIETGKMPGTVQMSIPLPNRADSLEFARVGPPIDGRSDDRLVVLVFREPPSEKYIVEAYRLRMNAPESVKSDSAASITLDKGLVLSPVAFAPQGNRGRIQRDRLPQFTSALYRVGLNSAGKPAGPARRSAPGRLSGQRDRLRHERRGPVLVTGRLDGSVYCGRNG